MAEQLAKQRARNREDKAIRRETILHAAERVLASVPYSEITVARVARDAGLAKSTVYLYFASKEQLMLAVFERELAAMFGDLRAELDRLDGRAPDAFAALLVDCLARRPLVALLATVLHAILEHNIDLVTAVRFKHALLAQLSDIGGAVERRLPFLRPGEGARLFLRAHALLIGVRQLSDPAPIMAEAHAQPGLEAFKIDFATEFSDCLVCLLRGMQRRAQLEEETSS